MGRLVASLIMVLLGVIIIFPSDSVAEEAWPAVVSRLRVQFEQSPENSRIKRTLAEALRNYGVILGNSEEWDLAVFNLEEAIRLDSGEIQYRKDLAHVLLGKALNLYNRLPKDTGGDSAHAEVKQLAEQSLEINPGLASAHLLVGDVDFGFNRIEEAEKAWERAKDLDPALEGLDSRFALLKSNVSRKKSETRGGVAGSVNWPGVVGELRLRLRQASDDLVIRQELANALHGCGIDLTHKNRWMEALPKIEEAVLLDPKNEKFIRNLAQTYYGAAVELQNNLSKSPQPKVDRVEIRRLLRQAISKDSTMANAYVVLGDIEYEAQNLDEAKKAWERAESLDAGMSGLDSRLTRLEDEYDAEVGMKQIPSVNFILRYEEEVKSSFGFDVKAKLLNARRVVGQAFNHWPARKIIVLLYSMETYRRVRHEVPQWSGGLYDGKIRIPLPSSSADVSSIENIVLHEYVHAVVGDITGGNCPQWFNEGLAEFQTAKFSVGDPLVAIRSSVKKNRLIPWTRLNVQFQNPSASTAQLAYDQAHSVVSYLDARYGFWRIRNVLDALAVGEDFGSALKKEFKISPEKLEENWRRWLEAD